MIKRIVLVTIVLCAFVFATENTAVKLTTNSGAKTITQKINYQGYLTDNSSNPITDPSFSVTFKIYNDEFTGSVQWEATKSVSVDNGVFSTLLDVSSDVFTGGATRWMELTIGGVALTPRTELTAVGYSYKTIDADKLQGLAPSEFVKVGDGAGGDLNGDYPNPSIADNAVTTSKIADTNVTMAKIQQKGATSGQVIKWNGSAWSPSDDNTGSGGAYLPLTGGTMTGAITNTGDPDITMGKGNFGSGNINPGTQAFVAGGNNKACGDFSVVSGGGGLSVSDSNSALGAYSTISGGSENKTIDMYSTVGGGRKNVATSQNATVGGGGFNTASGSNAVISGGTANTASGLYAVVGGGYGNFATNSRATVSGGGENTASGIYSTVPGGYANTAQGSFSFATGQQAIANHAGTFVWADSSNANFASTANNQFLIRANGNVGINTNAPTSPLTVNGIIQSTSGGIKFPDNSVQTSAMSGSNYLPLAGGNMTGAITNTGNPSITMGKANFGTTNSNSGTDAFVAGANDTASGNYSTVAGGMNNVVISWAGAIGGGRNNRATGVYAVVAGGGGPGTSDGNRAANDISAVGGGRNNNANGIGSTVGGGFRNNAIGDYTTVSGGSYNAANVISATVGGGNADTASGNYSTVSGGQLNKASAEFSTVDGGYGNVSSGGYAAIGGGMQNTANGAQAVVGGGAANSASSYAATIAGGGNNFASNSYSTVGGGFSNSASGMYTAIPGGLSNSASGKYSYASGRRAKANHIGAYVWADSTDADFATTSANQYLIRANGNVGINTNAPASPLTVAGMIQSTTGGYKFPDGSVQVTAGGSGSGSVTTVNPGTGIICSPNPITTVGSVGLDTTYADARYVNEAQASSVTSAMITDNTIVRGDVATNFKAPYADSADYVKNLSVVYVDSARISVVSYNAKTLQGKDTTALDGRYVNESQVNSIATAMIIDTNVTMAKIQQKGATSGQVIKWNGSAWAPADDNAGVEVDGVIGNEVTNATNGTLTRSGSGTAVSPYTLSLNLANTNTWSGAQTFSTTSNFPSGIWNSSGNVGVGTTTPSKKLEVQGSVKVTDTLFSSNVSSNSPLRLQTAGTTRMYIDDATGNVGVGTIAPASPFEVNGVIHSTTGGIKFPDNTVQTTAVTSGAGVYLPLAGGNMTGAITNTGSPSITMGKGNFGSGNSNSGVKAFVAGDKDTASGDFSTVSGGTGNKATFIYTTVGGGTCNEATGPAATIGGGSHNKATGPDATVGGGGFNDATDNYAMVGGGFYNTASGINATIGGGGYNKARGNYSVVAGGGYTFTADSNSAYGELSAIGGGRRNKATGSNSNITGGSWNTASGTYGTVCGGSSNVASAENTFATNNGSTADDDNSAAFNGTTTAASDELRCNILNSNSDVTSIDHPLDPNNKILNNYSVASPRMLLTFDGEAVIGSNGKVTVNLPDYFSALTKQPRIQLTGVGSSDVYVAEDVSGNQFVIGGKSGMKVYWEVSAERNDVSAQATRIMLPVEQTKTGSLSGHSIDDDFLVGSMNQLKDMGHGNDFNFRTAEGRAKYDNMMRALQETK